MSKITRIVTFTILVGLVLSACNLPSNTSETESANAVLTAAAQTVEASLTQAAVANPPTQAVLPTSTTAPLATSTLAVPTNTLLPQATATSDCDKAEFVTDVTVPDGTVFSPNEAFTKTWRLKNSGTCSWTPSYAVVFNSGDAMGGPASQALTSNVNPGETLDLSVSLKAPATAGDYRGYWKLRNAAGVLFSTFYVDIKVSDSTGGKFAVTSVDLSVSGSCGNFQIQADIKTNGPGTVTYKWIRSDGATDTATHPDLVYSAAGTKSVTTSWSTTASGSKWMDIYIDSPNHQQFGRANFSCP